jgi:hypothetical protein
VVLQAVNPTFGAISTDFYAQKAVVSRLPQNLVMIAK